MPKLKPLIYIFFFTYFVSYCTYNTINLLREHQQKKESSYDITHIKIYKPNYNKNKYVGVEKRDIFKTL
jgi:hypothetical protein